MLRSLFALAAIWLIAAPLVADDVREVTDANGQTWREVHRTVLHPQTVTQCMDQQQTYYQEKYDVSLCDTYRTYTVPVTEYRWESYWVGRFNPLVQPYLAQRLVPRTRWETRTEVVKVPVTQRNLVPVTRTVRVPVTTEQTANYDVVVSRHLVSPQSPALASSAGQDSGQSLKLGGTKNLDQNRPSSVARVAAGGAANADAPFARPPTNPAQVIAGRPSK